MKCAKCGRRIGLFNPGVSLSGSDSICFSCFRDLGFDPKSDSAMYLCYSDISEGRSVYELKRNARAAAHYVFNVHWSDEKTNKILEKYQKDWTDPDDRYDGMSKRDIMEACAPGDKVFKFPPLDIDVELSEGIVDSKPAVLVRLIDGKNNPLIGCAPKTKARKIIQLLSEHDVRISAELSGGDYRELVVFGDGEAVCDSNIPKPLRVQIELDWSSEIV